MSAIPLGPPQESNSVHIQMENTKMDIEGLPINSDEPRKYFFADEVKIGDKTVLTIDPEKQFYEETKPPRKSRWADRPLKRSYLS